MTPIFIKWAAIGLLMMAIILPSLGQQTAEDWFSETAAAHPAAELAGHPRRRRIKMETGS
jgi:hypothetical protein